MRMPLVLLVATSVATSSGCCGKVRNWFNKGAPCGTQTLAPTLISAPGAAQVPLAQPMQMAPPMQYAAPVATMVQPGPCCVPCCPDPCSVPCCEDVSVGSGGWVPAGSGGVYFGGYGSAPSDCGCNDGGGIQYQPGIQYQGSSRSSTPSSAPTSPNTAEPGSNENPQSDPRPLRDGSI